MLGVGCLGCVMVRLCLVRVCWFVAIGGALVRALFHRLSSASARGSSVFCMAVGAGAGIVAGLAVVCRVGSLGGIPYAGCRWGRATVLGSLGWAMWVWGMSRSGRCWLVAVFVGWCLGLALVVLVGVSHGEVWVWCVLRSGCCGFRD